MLSPAEEFWLRWHAEHSAPEVAERARVVLRAGGGTQAPRLVAPGITAAQAQAALDGYSRQELNEFGRPELKPEQLLRLFPTQVARWQHVARLAGQLFDATRALHNLPYKSRRLLLAAALLQPMAGAGEDGQAGLELLDHPKLAGLGSRQQAAVACLIKLQRKGYRADRDAQFRKLRTNVQQQMRALAALLQAADALDASQTQSTVLVAADLRPEGASLRLAGPSAPADSAALQNAWLWRTVFNHALKTQVVPDAEAAQAPPAATLPHPDQPMAFAIQRALGACLQTWQTSQAAAAQGDAAAQAKLEKAIDELRAAFGAFKSLLKRKPVQAVAPELRRLQRAAAAAAWCETAIADVTTFRGRMAPEKAAGLLPLENAWKQARQRRQAEFQEWIGGQAGAELYAELVALADAPPMRKSKTGDVRSCARPLLTELIEHLAEREAAVTVQQPKTIKRYRQALAGLAVALEALGGAVILGQPAAQLLADLARFQNRLERLRVSLQFDAAIGDFLDEWAEKQARDKSPQLFGAQPVLAYRQARKAQWSRLRRSLSRDWRPVRANRLRRQMAALLRTLESS